MVTQLFYIFLLCKEARNKVQSNETLSMRQLCLATLPSVCLLPTQKQFRAETYSSDSRLTSEDLKFRRSWDRTIRPEPRAQNSDPKKCSKTRPGFCLARINLSRDKTTYNYPTINSSGVICIFLAVKPESLKSSHTFLWNAGFFYHSF